MNDIPRDIPLTSWLPTSRAEMEAHGWDQADVILISGDAYVDHPSFGAAVIGRLLQAEGLRVAILPQPNWQDDLRDFRKFGQPRLFFAVTAGCMDSMVNHYTAAKRRRSDDAYTPAGRAGARPDYAVTTYSRILKQLYPDTPLIIGGIEASLRRLTHYDYWSDSFKPGILIESGADLLVYGMGEQPLQEIVRLLGRGVPFDRLDTIPQTAIVRPVEAPLPRNRNWQDLQLHSHQQCLQNKASQAENFAQIETESNRLQSHARLLQQVDAQRLIVNPPGRLATSAELDRSFAYPYTRLPHPRYRGKGVIPAYAMIRYSVTLHRGCFGGCSFCTISAHQGKFISSRSRESILQEIEVLSRVPGFAGTISDLGGPSANMYRMAGKRLAICQDCSRPSCLHPAVCPNLDTRHQPLLDLYEAASRVPGIKQIHVTSGLRYDLFLHPCNDPALKKDHQRYFETLVKRHVAGRLKVAPEHSSAKVLTLMRKPGFAMFQELKRHFDKLCRQEGLNQQLIPYFISSHPGSDLAAMAELAIATSHLGYRLEQVQDFTPTPMTLATEIYATGIDPYSRQSMTTAIRPTEKKLQRDTFFWQQPEKRRAVIQTLKKQGLTDLAERFAKATSGPINIRPGRNRPNLPTKKKTR